MSQGVSSIGSCMAFVAETPATIAAIGGFLDLTFIASSEVTSIGDVGPENEVITFNTVCDGKVNKRLGATNYGQQTLEIAYKGTNGAQAVLSEAVRTKVPISVKESLSSGDVLYYVAYVASFKTQVGGSSDYLRASVTLEIDSEIVEVAA